MLQLCTLASGSSGNSMLLSDGKTHILLDAGISARRITKALRELEVEPAALSGILITHEHSDHISGLATLTRQYQVPIYASEGTAGQLCCRIPAAAEVLVPFHPGEELEIGTLSVRSFSTPHDAAQSVGYSVMCGGKRVTVATDLGHLTEEVLEQAAGADLLVAETNHDEDWVRSGAYPYYLKQRILGDHGHLSNETGGALIRHCVQAGARTVLLAHLSTENNTPRRAYEVVRQALAAMGASTERDVVLEVAPRCECSRRYYIE